jgi:hypothetical protein
MTVFQDFSSLQPARQVNAVVSRLEIGVRQMSGNKLMILKLKLTIETDNRATVGVPPGVMFS